MVLIRNGMPLNLPVPFNQALYLGVILQTDPLPPLDS